MVRRLRRVLSPKLISKDSTPGTVDLQREVNGLKSFKVYLPLRPTRVTTSFVFYEKLGINGAPFKRVSMRCTRAARNRAFRDKMGLPAVFMIDNHKRHGVLRLTT